MFISREVRYKDGRRVVVLQQQKDARLRRLRKWLRENGLCNLCALSIAIAQTEREYEGTVTKVEPGPGCARKDRPESCGAIALRVKPTMPPTPVNLSAMPNSGRASRSAE